MLMWSSDFVGMHEHEFYSSRLNEMENEMDMLKVDKLFLQQTLLEKTADNLLLLSMILASGLLHLSALNTVSNSDNHHVDTINSRSEWFERSYESKIL